jgi:hypothetical protein
LPRKGGDFSNLFTMAWVLIQLGLMLLALGIIFNRRSLSRAKK